MYYAHAHCFYMSRHCRLANRFKHVYLYMYIYIYRYNGYNPIQRTQPKACF